MIVIDTTHFTKCTPNFKKSLELLFYPSPLLILSSFPSHTHTHPFSFSSFLTPLSFPTHSSSSSSGHQSLCTPSSSQPLLSKPTFAVFYGSQIRGKFLWPFSSIFFTINCMFGLQLKILRCTFQWIEAKWTQKQGSWFVEKITFVPNVILQHIPKHALNDATIMHFCFGSQIRGEFLWPPLSFFFTINTFSFWFLKNFKMKMYFVLKIYKFQIYFFIIFFSISAVTLFYFIWWGMSPNKQVLKL